MGAFMSHPYEMCYPQDPTFLIQPGGTPYGPDGKFECQLQSSNADWGEDMEKPPGMYRYRIQYRDFSDRNLYPTLNTNVDDQTMFDITAPYYDENNKQPESNQDPTCKNSHPTYGEWISYCRCQQEHVDSRECTGYPSWADFSQNPEAFYSGKYGPSYYGNSNYCDICPFGTYKKTWCKLVSSGTFAFKDACHTCSRPNYQNDGGTFLARGAQYGWYCRYTEDPNDNSDFDCENHNPCQDCSTVCGTGVNHKMLFTSTYSPIKHGDYYKKHYPDKYPDDASLNRFGYQSYYQEWMLKIDGRSSYSDLDSPMYDTDCGCESSPGSNKYVMTRKMEEENSLCGVNQKVTCQTHNANGDMRDFLIGAYQICFGCEACPQGYYQDQTSHSNVECNLRTCGINQKISGSTCISCPQGYYQDQTSHSETECMELGCPRGKYGIYSTSEENDCTNCPVGYYSDTSDQASCKACNQCTESYCSTWSYRTMNAGGTTHTQQEWTYYQDQAGQSSCKRCPNGRWHYVTYPEIATSVTCTRCNQGRYYESSYNLYGGWPRNWCFPCGSGKYQDSSDHTTSSCKTCPSGFNAGFAAAECEQCAAGKYYYTPPHCTNCVGECKSCPVGYITSSNGQTQCTACNNGLFQTQSGQTTCKSCGMGQYANSRSSSCTACATGRYNNQNVNPAYSCKTCGQGQYAPNALVACYSCGFGKYADQNINTAYSCKDCQAPKYSNLQGQSQCSTCSLGLYQNEHGQPDCKSCSVGHFALSATSQSCSYCPVGYKKTLAANSYGVSISNACGACPKGYYQNTIAQTQCIACLPGQYNILTAQTSCAYCGVGTYSPGPAIACEGCPAGYFQDATQNTQNTCKKCPSGWVSENANVVSECQACGVGKYELDNVCTDCLSGTFQDETKSTICKACPEGTSQIDRGQTSCIDCLPGLYSTGTTKLNTKEEKYKLRYEGRCHDERGWRDIMIASTCIRAVPQLGFTDMAFEYIHSNDRSKEIPACVLYPGQNKIIFNYAYEQNHDYANECSTTAPCVCERINFHKIMSGSGSRCSDEPGWRPVSSRYACFTGFKELEISSDTTIWGLYSSVDYNKCVYSESLDRVLFTTNPTQYDKPCHGNVICLCERENTFPYKKRTQGKCSDEPGWEAITTTDDCHSARMAMEGEYLYKTNIRDVAPYIWNRNDYPPGCFITNDWVDYHFNRYESDTPCSDTYACYCVQTDHRYKLRFSGRCEDNGWHTILGQQYCSNAAHYGLYKSGHTSTQTSWKPSCFYSLRDNTRFGIWSGVRYKIDNTWNPPACSNNEPCLCDRQENYKKLITGRCTDDPEWEYITSSSECDDYAKIYAVNSKANNQYSEKLYKTDYPSYCWLHAGWAYYNTYEQNLDCNDAEGRECICRRKNAALSSIALKSDFVETLTEVGGLNDRMTKDQARKRCQEEGYRLCWKSDIAAQDLCSFGWVEDYHVPTYWRSDTSSGCGSGSAGWNDKSSSISVGNAHCCISSTVAENCKSCVVGTYQDETAASACKDCENGSFTTSVGQALCQLCSYGRYSPSKTQSCTDCVRGQFQNNEINTAYGCKQCPQNTFQTQEGMSFCYDCPDDEFTNTVGNVECLCKSSGLVRNFGCGCDIADCTAGTVWNHEICAEDQEHYYVLPSQTYKSECRSSVLEYEDEECHVTTKKECEHVPPLGHNNMSLRCEWRPKANTKIESNTNCSKNEHCQGLILREEVAYFDMDDDGVYDNRDAFPEDPTEQFDTDNDGIGDNRDQFPEDPTEQFDTDNDNVGDNRDEYPVDETKQSMAGDVGDDLQNDNFIEIPVRLENEYWVSEHVLCSRGVIGSSSYSASFFECRRDCENHEHCIGFSYKAIENLCRLSKTTCRNVFDFRTRAGWNSYTKYGGDTPLRQYFKFVQKGECSYGSLYWDGHRAPADIDTLTKCAEYCYIYKKDFGYHKGFTFDSGGHYSEYRCKCERTTINSNCYYPIGYRYLAYRYDFSAPPSKPYVDIVNGWLVVSGKSCTTNSVKVAEPNNADAELIAKSLCTDGCVALTSNSNGWYAYSGNDCNPYTAASASGNTLYIKENGKLSDTQVLPCEYVTADMSNDVKCLCGDDLCDYESGFVCDWSLLAQKQLGLISTVCSMPTCTIGRNDRVCKCGENTCPSGSVCTDYGQCIYEYWDMVMDNFITEVQTTQIVTKHPAKRTVTYEYVKITSGSCEDNGFEPIYNHDECVDAFEQEEGTTYTLSYERAFGQAPYLRDTPLDEYNTGPMGCWTGSESIYDYWRLEGYYTKNLMKLIIRPEDQTTYTVFQCGENDFTPQGKIYDDEKNYDAGCYCKNPNVTIVELYGDDVVFANYEIDKYHTETTIIVGPHEKRDCISAKREYTAFHMIPHKPDQCGVLGGASSCLVCDIPYGDGVYNCPCIMKPDSDQCSAERFGVIDKCGVCGGDNICKEDVKNLFMEKDKDTANDKDTEVSKGCSGRCGDNLTPLYEEVDINNTYVRILTNGIPNHMYMMNVKVPPKNKVCEHNRSLLIPQDPVRRSFYEDTSMGPIGILKTGAYLFNHQNEDGKVATVVEEKTLDSCHGHASPHCEYHYHELSQKHACTYDSTWDECEHIGYMRDGFKIYSHCRKDSASAFLKSCYVKIQDSNGSLTSHYEYDPTSGCDLDSANAYDFTGKGFVDAENNPITGWAYVASESYPYVMPSYIGEPQPLEEYDGDITINNNLKCFPVEGIDWLIKWSEAGKLDDVKSEEDICVLEDNDKMKREYTRFEEKCASQRPCGAKKMWIYPPDAPAAHVSFCTDKGPIIKCTNGGMEPLCIDKCGIPNGDNDCECYGGLVKDACGVCGGDAIYVCRAVTKNQTLTFNITSFFGAQTFKDVTFESEGTDLGLVFDHSLLNIVNMSRGLDNSPNPCTSENPCGVCQGYCYSDDQCAGNLKCMRYGETEGWRRIAPGCITTSEDSTSSMMWSMCYDDTLSSVENIDRILTPVNTCYQSGGCGECDGHCTSDAQCAGGLKCLIRSGDEPVPGCILPEKGDVSGRNFCYKPLNGMFDNSIFIDTTFKSDMRSVSFVNSKLINVDFTGIDISHADFRNAVVDAKDVFTASDFCNAIGSEVFKYEQDYKYDLKRRDVSGLDFSNALLTEASLMRVEGKLQACPLQENLPSAYYCHDGYISGFRAWHNHSKLWPTYRKIQDIDLHENIWLPKYERISVDTKQLDLVGNIPRSALFNPNLGQNDIHADEIQHRGTASEFKSCDYAILPVGYRCFHGKYVIGPGMDVSGVDITDMDLSDVDGTHTQWYGNDQKAASCPSNMIDMQSTKALNGVYCIEGKLYGRGKQCGLSWAEEIFYHPDKVFRSKYITTVLRKNRLHWIFSPEQKSRTTVLSKDHLLLLDSFAITDIARHDDCNYIIDVPHRVCISNEKLFMMLYIDEVRSTTLNPLEKTMLDEKYEDLLQSLSSGYYNMKRRPVGFSTPSNYQMRAVQLKDFADEHKPEYVRSSGACIRHEGYSDIMSYEECLEIRESRTLEIYGFNGGFVRAYKADRLNIVGGIRHKTVSSSELKQIRSAYNHYSDHPDAGFGTQILKESTQKLSGCYVTCIQKEGGPYTGTRCRSDIFSSNDWAVPDHESTFCEETPYRCICKKIDNWARHGLHILGPSMSTEALSSLSYINFDGISLKNVDAMGKEVKSSYFDNVVSVSGFHNFTSLEHSRFVSSFEGINMGSLTNYNIGRLVDVRTPQTTCPIFGGSGGYCVLAENNTCVPSEIFDDDYEYAKTICDRLTTFECNRTDPMIIERKLISSSSYEPTLQYSWNQVENSQVEDSRGWGHYMLRGDSTMLLSGTVHSVQATNYLNEFEYKSIPSSGLVQSRDECENLVLRINSTLINTLNTLIVTRGRRKAMTSDEILLLRPAVTWHKDSVFNRLEYVPEQYTETIKRRNMVHDIFPLGFKSDEYPFHYIPSQGADIDFLLTMNLIEGYTWENGKCWAFSGIRGVMEALSEDVWSKRFDHDPCDDNLRCSRCQRTAVSYRCTCDDTQVGKNCDVDVDENAFFRCWSREPIFGVDQICNAFDDMFLCNTDSRCMWSDVPPRESSDEYFETKNVYCDNNMFIGEDFYYGSQDLSEIDFSVADSDTLSVTKNQGFDNIGACPKKLPEFWLCTEYDVKIHKDERVGDKNISVILGEISPLQNEWDQGETKCCKGFDFSKLDLGSVKTFQSERSFRFSNWTGAFGNARNFLKADLGEEYSVVETLDDSFYALIGPNVDLRNRDLFNINLYDVDLSGADLRGVVTGWNDKNENERSGCTRALPEDWSCVDTSAFNLKITKYLLVGPEVDLSYSILTGFNFSGADLSIADLNRVYAPLVKDGCPDSLPLHWGCTNESVLVGPSANLDGLVLSSIDTIPEWHGKVSVCPLSAPNACLDGWFLGHSSSSNIDILRNLDISGVTWDGTNLTGSDLIMLRGQANDCPILDESKYVCIDNYIVGRFQNLSEVDMTGWDLSAVSLVGADLTNAHGILQKCPKPGIGYKCIHHRIVGRGANIDNMNFRNQDLSGVEMELYTNLFDESRNISLRASFGILDSCFDQKKNPFGSICIQQRIIGPEQDLTGLDLTDTNGIAMVDTTGMYGRVAKCPLYNCEGRFVEGGLLCRTFGVICNTGSRVLLGRYVDLQRTNVSRDIFKEEEWNYVNIEGVDLSGFDLRETIFNGVEGKVSICTDMLPEDYKCVGNYIFAHKDMLKDPGSSSYGYANETKSYGIGWGYASPPEDFQENVAGLVLSHMTLPDVNLDYTVWHNVRVAHNVTSMEEVYGTTDNSCSSTQLPNGYRCVASENDKKVIVRRGVHLKSFHLMNDFWQAQDFQYLKANDDAKWTSIHFYGVDLRNSKLSNITFTDVWGYVGISEQGGYMHASEYPSTCLTIANFVFCGSASTLIALDIDFDHDEIPVFEVNTTFPEMRFTGEIRNLNVENVDLSNVRFDGALANIYGHPTFCPESLPDLWACGGTPLSFIGPYQRTGPLTIRSYLERIPIDMSGMNITGWFFDEYYETRSYTTLLPWNGTGIVGTPLNYPKYHTIIDGQWVGPFTTHVGALNADKLKLAYLFETNLEAADIYQELDSVVEIRGSPESLPEGIIEIDIGNGTFLAGRGLHFDANALSLYWNVVDPSADQNTANPKDMMHTLSNISGPLKSCKIEPPDITDEEIDTMLWDPMRHFKCVYDTNDAPWLLGPGVSWTGFDGNGANLSHVTISLVDEVQILPSLLLACPDVLPNTYTCLKNKDNRYSIVGPYLDMMASGFVINTPNITLHLIGSYLDGSHFTATQQTDVHIDFDSTTTWLGVVIDPNINLMKLNSTVCPFKFTPRMCDTDVITCNVIGLDPNKMVYDGYVWPSNQSLIDRRLCVRNMDLSRANDNNMLHIQFDNNEIDNTIFPDNSSFITFAQPPTGYITQCPTLLHKKYQCVYLKHNQIDKYMLAHSKSSFVNVDLSYANLSNIHFSKNVYWSNINGTLDGCPAQLPYGWKCVNNTLFGINTDYSTLSREFDFNDINLDGLDLTGSKFAPQQILRNFRGNLAGCPTQLPDHYFCYTRESYCQENCKFILGPYVSIEGVNMESTPVGQRSTLGLEGVHGKAYRCPVLSNLFKDAGYACSSRTQHHIIGPSVDLSGIDLGVLTKQLSVIEEGRVSLTFAMYNGHYLVDDVGSTQVCRQFEESIGNGMCEECKT